jgi:hypothetical protein
MTIEKLPPDKQQAPELSENQILPSQEFPVSNSIVGQLIFGRREAILGGKFARENSTFRIEVLRDSQAPEEAKTYMIVLKNARGEEATFRLDKKRKRLIGWYREYRITDQEMATIERMEQGFN